MIDDFKTIECSFPENRDIKIYPISDLHLGAKDCMIKSWMKFIKKLEQEPDSYITISGDMMNNSIVGSVGDVYNETMTPIEQKEFLRDSLKPIKDKILCITPGNHEYRSTKVTNDHPLYDVAFSLGIEDKYRQNGAFLCVRIGDKSKRGSSNPSYMIAVAHGAGGGRKRGSSVNRIEDFAKDMEGLDMLIVGHTHKPVTFPIEKIVLDPFKKVVKTKTVKLVVATSWVEYGDYAFRHLMSPGGYCLQEIMLNGNMKEMRVLQ